MTPHPSKGISFAYPIVLYFGVSLLMDLLVTPFLPLDAVKRQGVTALVGGLCVYVCFLGRGADGVRKRLLLRPITAHTLRGGCAAILLLGCAGIALNNIISFINLARVSDTYQQVEQAFYSSSVGWELLILGIVTPMVEELIYRGAVYERLRADFGARAAIVGSAVVFGVMHMNLVQALYAGLLGLLLVLLMENYQDVRVPMCGHITANVVSILRSELGFFAWLAQGEPLFLCGTIALVGVSLLMGVYAWRKIEVSFKIKCEKS